MSGSFIQVRLKLPATSASRRASTRVPGRQAPGHTEDFGFVRYRLLLGAYNGWNQPPASAAAIKETPCLESSLMAMSG